MNTAMVLLAFYSITHWAVFLPQDHFQRTAIKALAGDFGAKPQWVLKAYRRGLEQGVTATIPIWLTTYGYERGRDFSVDGHDRSCTLATAASNRIPQFSYIWNAKTGMRKILDTGSRHNDQLARYPLRDSSGRQRWKPAYCWADVWYPSSTSYGWESGQTYNCAIISP